MYDNLNTYRVFYTVANTGNISKAANALFISQPAISKSISKLEEGVGYKLFDRTSKGVILTEEGKILYDSVKTAFDSITKGEDEIKKIHELGIGQIRIGVSTSLCKHILLDYLQDFIIENPHIKVIIDCHSTHNTLKLLQNGQIDLGLICKTEIPKGYHYHELREIHDVFVASSTYLNNLSLREVEDTLDDSHMALPFAGNFLSILQAGDIANEHTTSKKMTTRDILEKSNLMMLEKHNITRAHIDNYLDTMNIEPNQILEVNNMDLLIDFASIGMGVACVVREFAKDALDSQQIVELPLEKAIKKRTVGFVYPDSPSNQTVLSKFLDFCKLGPL